METTMTDLRERARTEALLHADKGVPSHTLHALLEYAICGVPTGGFLRAVLSNDLLGAFRRADSQNRAALEDIVKFVYNDLPMKCWGSPAKVDAWIEAKRK